jgi:type 2 lantibiotic biosynthesis protein LanM
MLPRRLAPLGLTERDLVALLAESAAHLAARVRVPPPWLLELQQAYAAAPPPDGSTRGGFLELAGPLLAVARGELEIAARALANRYGAAAVPPARAVELLAPTLEERVGHALMRPLVLELHVSGLRGELTAEDPGERFRQFCSRLTDPAVAIGILTDYPVLARYLTELTHAWTAAGAAFLEHLAADAPELARRFGVCPAELTAVTGGAGDPHRRGRTVLILQFEGGASVVYKPRSLAVDARFQQLLQWFNGRGDHPTLATLEVIDRGDHGWMEWARAGSCTDAAQVERFHRRLGALLALAHVVAGTDFHYENLVAAGEHPVLVDLETLFHPLPPLPPTLRPDLALARRAVERSVLRTGLLPFRIEDEDEGGGFDPSGLAAVEGALSPDAVITWENPGTDQMRAVRRRVELPAGHNRPHLDGRPVDALEYARPLVEGFSSGYRTLERHRGELVARLEAFAHDPIRVVLRPTRLYHRISFESLHPDLLGDALERDRLLDRLWFGIAENPALKAVVAAERRALERGDIPYFESSPASRDAWTEAGDHYTGFFPRCGLDEARERALALAEEDLEHQTWLLESALAPLALERPEVPWPHYDPALLAPWAGACGGLPAALLEGAVRVADRLARRALSQGAHVTWLGLDYSGGRWALQAVGEDLYSGLPGIALFFGHLAEVTGEPRYRALGRKAVHTLIQQVRDRAPEIQSIGAFQGWGGVLFATAHLFHRFPETALGELADDALLAIEARLPRDRELDLVAGTAGALVALLVQQRSFGGSRPLQVAIRCGEHLLALAEDHGPGIAWPHRESGTTPLSGFSHGAAGIGWALGRLADATGQERFQTAARAAFRFETGRFVPERGNWLDPDDPNRDEARARSSPTALAWCYGAPGIGLSRLAWCGDPELRADLLTAVTTTRHHGFGRNHCLCHGDLGNLEFLHQAARALGCDELTREVDEQCRRLLASLDTHGFLCGVPTGVETPGLMNGLAGIGYGLLRLAAPDRVPSVLTLEPPR